MGWPDSRIPMYAMRDALNYLYEIDPKILDTDVLSLELNFYQQGNKEPIGSRPMICFVVEQKRIVKKDLEYFKSLGFNYQPAVIEKIPAWSFYYDPALFFSKD
jgi:hypothetical protein